MAKKPPKIERIGTQSFLAGNNPADRLNKSLFVGAVTDVIQYTNFYEISVDNSPAIYCTPLNHGSLSLIGVRDHVAYAIGTKVLCFMPPGNSIGFILGCVPDFDTDLNFNQSEWLSQYSGVGVLDDSAHSAAMDIGTPPYLFANSRPYDAFPGEWGISNPFGLAMHMGLTSFQLRAGELAGVYGFLLDKKLRIQAHNLQMWSALRERFEGSDQGENVGITISSPYAWEMLGAKRPSVSAVTPESSFNYTTDKQGVDSNWKYNASSGNISQLESDQVAIPRIIELEGTLGYGTNSMVAMPPADQPDVEKQSNKTNYLGVSQFRRTLDGTIEIRSARQVVIEKTCFLPVPKQLKDFSDPTGDSSDNGSANFAGVYGATQPDFDLPEFVTAEDGATTLIDRLSIEHTRVFDYFLRGKPLDWHVPTQADLAATTGHTSYVIDPRVAKSFPLQAKASLPMAFTLPVDHIKNNLRDYYASKSGIYLLDTGGILIEDAWGSQLLLERGNIKLTCPGDFFFVGGRNFNVLSPNDIHLRAGGHADLSAGKGDVRIKAEKNLMILGGNSKSGVVLIESRGEGTTQNFDGVGTEVSGSGIIFKSAKGAINLYGQNIYARSTNNGTITLDADKGAGQVSIYASSVLELLQSSKTTIFGSTPNKPGTPSGIMYTTNWGFLHSSNGKHFMSSYGSFYCSGNGAVNGSLVAASLASATGGTPGQYTNTTQNALDEIQNQGESIAAAGRQLSNEPYRPSRPYEKSVGYGFESNVEFIGFSFRTDAQYSIDIKDGNKSTWLTESRWQQNFRANQRVSDTWVEPAVLTHKENIGTMPYPGYQTWFNTDCYQTYDNQAWSFTSGETLNPVTSINVENKKPGVGYIVNYQRP